MAQLPPKAPPLQSWPGFADSDRDSFWVDGGDDDDGCGFLPVCRHVRSLSDSFAFFLPEDCRGRNSAFCGGGDLHGDDDRQQLMSIVADAVAAGPTLSCSGQSSPSNHSGINSNEKLKSEAEEVQSSSERVVDPKRIKRILANRQSAQRSRVRKLKYISELERSVSSLQGEVSVLSPRVAFMDHQRLLLTADNSVLKQRIAALAHDKIFKDAHQEALKNEIEELRKKVYYQQNVDTEEEGEEELRNV